MLTLSHARPWRVRCDQSEILTVAPSRPAQCHLPHSTSESFTLHLDQNGTPFSLDYFVGPIPHNGACPKRSRKASAQSSHAQVTLIANTTVALRSPSFPPLYVYFPALQAQPREALRTRGCCTDILRDVMDVADHLHTARNYAYRPP